MLESSSISSTLLQELVNDKTNPWLVLWVGMINQDLCGLISSDTVKPFEAANKKLMEWWPGMEADLADIYQQEVVDCWIKYDTLPKEEEPLNTNISHLFKGIYVQLWILRDFEKRSGRPYKGLPNDVNDIGFNTFEDLWGYYRELVFPKKNRKLSAWIVEVLGNSPPEWKVGKKQLFDLASMKF